MTPTIVFNYRDNSTKAVEVGNYHRVQSHRDSNGRRPVDVVFTGIEKIPNQILIDVGMYCIPYPDSVRDELNVRSADKRID